MRVLNVRITKVDELQFLTCFKYGLWGSKTARFRNWKIGDKLIFMVDKKIAAIAEISSAPFVSDVEVWCNGSYPNRVELNFLIVLSVEKRIPNLGEVRDAITRAWGVSYGHGILNQEILPQDEAKVILSAINNQQNDIIRYKEDLEQLLIEAENKREIEKSKRRRTGIIDENSKEDPQQISISEIAVINSGKEEIYTEKEGRDHSRAQMLLKILGIASGCSISIATNDRKTTYKGHLLGENCLDKLPNFGLNEESTAMISYIDIIWIRQNSPLCAFEVETTTSIYSGLLRMSDLISLVPSLKIKLFIVAPMERKEKVMKELRRATFQRSGLSDYCKFIPLEELENLLDRVSDLAGHINPSVIDEIAYGAVDS